MRKRLELRTLSKEEQVEIEQLARSRSRDGFGTGLQSALLCVLHAS